MNPLTNKILNWFDQNRRPMPWRDHPTPYYVWISEIMAQQTRIDTVMGYFERFIQTFPTIEALANASEESVLKQWQGLGYYSRARNIHKLAQIIMNDYQGELPQTYDQLISLPGIGPYTAGAIASIAFGQTALAIDGNVNRVIARVYGIKDDLSTRVSQRLIEERVSALISQERPGDFNQGLMEIGALVCIPNGAPKCTECPLQEACVAYNKQLTDVIPMKKKKTTVKVEPRTVIVMRYGHEIAIRKRPSQGLLASMYEVLHVEGHWDAEDIVQFVPNLTTIYPLMNHQHVYSHLIWQMKGYVVDVKDKDPNWVWVNQEEVMNRYAIPNAFQPFIENVLEK